MKIYNDKKISKIDYQKKNEGNLKDIKKAHNQEVIKIKEQHAENIKLLRQTERKKLSEEIEEERNRWQKMKDKWQERRNALKSEIEKEELNFRNKIDSDQSRLTNQLEFDLNKFNHQMAKLDERKEKILRETQDNATEDINREKIKTRENIEKIKEQKKHLENSAIKSLGSFSTQQLQQIDKELNIRDKEYKFLLENKQKVNNKRIDDLEKLNRVNLEQMGDFHRNKLRQTENENQRKIEKITKEGQVTMTNVTNKTQEDINDLKKRMSREKEYQSNRSQDPFYRANLLNPKIFDNNQEYILKIKLPEHEKDSIIIGADGRNLRITQTRKFTDTMNIDGTVSKSSKTESITQSIKLEDLINPRKITQSYQNDEIVFKIPKA